MVFCDHYKPQWSLQNSLLPQQKLHSFKIYTGCLKVHAFFSWVCRQLILTMCRYVYIFLYLKGTVKRIFKEIVCSRNGKFFLNTAGPSEHDRCSPIRPRGPNKCLRVPLLEHLGSPGRMLEERVLKQLLTDKLVEHACNIKRQLRELSKKKLPQSVQQSLQWKIFLFFQFFNRNCLPESAIFPDTFQEYSLASLLSTYFSFGILKI